VSENKLDLTIATDDITKLQQQIYDSASLYASYAVKLEDVRNNISQISLDMRVMEANIASKLRELNPKISESRIDKMLWEEAAYIDINRTLNQLKTQEGKLRAVVKGIELRHSLMIASIPLIREEIRKII